MVSRSSFPAKRRERALVVSSWFSVVSAYADELKRKDAKDAKEERREGDGGGWTYCESEEDVRESCPPPSEAEKFFLTPFTPPDTFYAPFLTPFTPRGGRYAKARKTSG